MELRASLTIRALPIEVAPKETISRTPRFRRSFRYLHTGSTQR
jgi:hypothetical protein